MGCGLEKLIKNSGKLIKSLVLTSAIAVSAMTFIRAYENADWGETGRTGQTIEAKAENSEEANIEQAIDNKFQEYFRNYSINGEKIRLNMPFGENGERSKNRDYNQEFYYSGKGNPADLWNIVDRIVESKRFKGYVSLLKQSGEKVVIFDLETQKYGVYDDKKLLSKIKRGKYPGNDSLVYIYKKDGSLEKKDIYNYLYCLGGIGVDCSGFVYNIQKNIAAEKGVNLDKVLAKKLGVQEDRLPIYIGTWLYDPEEGYSENVEDRISNIKPGDIILFRGKEGKICHSAVIQSVNLTGGVIKYVQNTDWAPQDERGVHESLIMFNPENPDISLKDKSLLWEQEIKPTFRGEQAICWQDDGDRYNAYNEYGGGMVVRLKYDE